MPPNQSRPSPAISRIYLMLYNTICAFFWLRILVLAVDTLISAPDKDIPVAYTTLEPWTRCAQTLAVAEILHAATGSLSGITRSPVFTTFTQVFARSVQVWAINYAFPEVTAPSAVYLAMLLAWSTADVIRYLYFAIMLAGYPVPRALKWSRYSLFTILYPIGISSEWWLIYKVTNVTTNMILAGTFYFCLGLYVPGSAMMYTYMLKQRKKVLTQN